MKANLKNVREHGRNYGNEKEMVECWNVVAVYKGRAVNAITCRVYMGRSRNASAVYATIWVRSGPRFKSGAAGTGTAGGYGYHKTSAAVAGAVSDAGIRLFRDVNGAQHPAHFGGEGDSAIDDALRAIARAQGYRGDLLIVRN